MKLDHIFTTPITFMVKDADHLNNAFIKDIEVLWATSEGLHRSNQKGWHSQNDFFNREEASFKRIAGALIAGVKAATLTIVPAFDQDKVKMHVEGWVNVNPKGAFNTPHDHPGFVLSGCYYVQVPESEGRGGMIEFLDPRNNISVYGLPSEAVFSNKIKRKPKAGIFYIFPSYLMHWVYPNEEECDRISIAFNVRFIKKTSEV